MQRVKLADVTFSLPMPVFLVIEDVGWWQGEDGSAWQQPFRNRFSRRHCLADYEALAALARRLNMRIALGMVMGEWDRSNFLKDVPGATWMGHAWDNRLNQGPWLSETGEYLREQAHCLELAMHGVCHEFWRNGQMQRSEFHDDCGTMRPAQLVCRHLEAYARLLEENGFTEFPRLFIPPALNHSFGNNQDSIQCLLRTFGIEYVTTRFSRAKQLAPPLHEMLTRECGVILLERGVSPVSWHGAAAKPEWNFSGPILPLHWGNLLHPEPQCNMEVVDAWADMLLAGAVGLEYTLAQDVAACWSQAAAHYLARLQVRHGGLVLDIKALTELFDEPRPVLVKIQDTHKRVWRADNATMVGLQVEPNGIVAVELLPAKGVSLIRVFPA